jgi:hypothetical protein
VRFYADKKYSQTGRYALTVLNKAAGEWSGAPGHYDTLSNFKLKIAANSRDSCMVATNDTISGAYDTCVSCYNAGGNVGIVFPAIAPVAIYPANAADSVPASVTFRWGRDSTNADSFYVLQTWKSTDSASTVTWDTTTSTSFTKNLDTVATYSWQVQGGNSSGVSAYSTAWMFTTSNSTGTTGGRGWSWRWWRGW